MTILVGEGPVVTGSVRGHDVELLLTHLLMDPMLSESATALKETEVQKIKAPYPSGNEDFDFRSDAGHAFWELPEDSKYVYVFQKECATASPLFVEFVGTDEITTCVGLVIRDPSSGLTSIGHFDTQDCVPNGVTQLVDSVVSLSSKEFQVHLVGAFDDRNEYDEDERPLQPSSRDEYNSRQWAGWSWPIALKMVEVLQNSSYDFKLETCCILKHNTSIGPNGHPYPSIRGIMVETSSGRIAPAQFEPLARGPDGTIRGVSVTTVNADLHRVPTLLRPYETLSDTFVIRQFQWTSEFTKYAKYMLNLRDPVFLKKFSTSPYAESSDFLPLNRRIFDYIVSFPDWQQTFPTSEARVFTRSNTGGWNRKLSGDKCM